MTKLKNVRPVPKKRPQNDGVDLFTTDAINHSDESVLSTLTDKEKNDIERYKYWNWSDGHITEQLMWNRVFNKLGKTND